jgi:hypothetical protein
MRPWITDSVILSLRSEEELLGYVEGDLEQFYFATLQALKLEGYIEYLQQRGAWGDVMVIVRTLFLVFFW